MENKRADELAKMASGITQWVKEDVISQVELVAQIDQTLALNSGIIEEADWRIKIIIFLQEGRLPKDPVHALQMKRRETRFSFIEDNLYKRAFS